jgi:UDP-2,4-diacetamido-2,4,6-trideoxy-beta-L-altropyranose hydrolase
MRCLALAQAWQERGGLAVFAMVECPPGLVQRLREEHCQVHILEADSWGEESRALSQVADKYSAEWVVLDGYQFDSRYQQSLRGRSFRVLAIDDFGHVHEWAVDAILNQNIYGPSETYSAEEDCVLLLGLDYALLRREFLPDRKITTNRPLRRILLTLGGGDPNNASAQLLRILSDYISPQVQIRVVVGSANPNMDAVAETATCSRNEVSLAVDVRDMSEHYYWADGVISAGGSTCWEWLRYRLPACVVVIAENQVRVAEDLADQGLALSLGRADQLDPRVVGKLLSNWVDVPTVPRAHVDGHGASRVAAVLTDGLWIRRAVSSDARLYFEWANDPSVRQASHNSASIDWGDHAEWFQSRLNSGESRLFVAEDVSKAVGQVRFDLQASGDWLIDFSVAPGHRGQGIGPRMLSQAIRRVRAEGHRPLIATVKLDNARSKAVFDRLGFVEVDNSERGVVFRLGATCDIS